MKVFLIFAIVLIVILAFALVVLTSLPSEYYDNFFKSGLSGNNLPNNSLAINENKDDEKK